MRQTPTTGAEARRLPGGKTLQASQDNQPPDPDSENQRCRNRQCCDRALQYKKVVKSMKGRSQQESQDKRSPDRTASKPVGRNPVRPYRSKQDVHDRAGKAACGRLDRSQVVEIQYVFSRRIAEADKGRVDDAVNRLVKLLQVNNDRNERQEFRKFFDRSDSEYGEDQQSQRIVGGELDRIVAKSKRPKAHVEEFRQANR